MQDFAQWLRRTREAVGVTQEVLAERVASLDRQASFHQTRLSAWERARSLPALRQYNAMSRALGLEPALHEEGRRLWELAEHEYWGLLHPLSPETPEEEATTSV